MMYRLKGSILFIKIEKYIESIDYVLVPIGPDTYKSDLVPFKGKEN